MTKHSKALNELAASLRARKMQQEVAKKSGKSKPQTDPLHATVNEFAARHGDYERHNGRVLNRGGTAIDRWIREGVISATQQAAILHMYRLWELTDSSRSVVANLDRTVFGCKGEGNEAEIDARRELHRIRDGFPAKWWDVFENVCRFDEPAGTAGSRIANVNRSAAEGARIVVCMIADTIFMRERLSY